MEPKEQYSYWERPWTKWVILAAALVQFWALWVNVRDYQKVQAADIFSPEQWEAYASAQQMHCAVGLITGIGFLAIFLIGFFAKTKRCAKICEGVLLLLVGVSLGAVQTIILGEVQALWLVCTLLALGGSLCSFYRAWKSSPKKQ